LKYFDKGPKPYKGNDLSRVIEDDIEGIAGDPDGQYDIITGKLKVQGDQINLNFRTTETIFNYDSEEEGEKTPVRSGNNSPNPTILEQPEASTSTIILQQPIPSTSGSTLHPDVTEVIRSRSRSPIHTNHPELDDLIKGNTRRFWDDTDLSDIFDTFK
jgi:hypothetical protein